MMSRASTEAGLSVIVFCVEITPFRVRAGRGLSNELSHLEATLRQTAGELFFKLILFIKNKIPQQRASDCVLLGIFEYKKILKLYK